MRATTGARHDTDTETGTGTHKKQIQHDRDLHAGMKATAFSVHSTGIGARAGAYKKQAQLDTDQDTDQEQEASHSGGSREDRMNGTREDRMNGRSTTGVGKNRQEAGVARHGSRNGYRANDNMQEMFDDWDFRKTTPSITKNKGCHHCSTHEIDYTRVGFET